MNIQVKAVKHLYKIGYNQLFNKTQLDLYIYS